MALFRIEKRGEMKKKMKNENSCKQQRNILANVSRINSKCGMCAMVAVILFFVFVFFFPMFLFLLFCKHEPMKSETIKVK